MLSGLVLNQNHDLAEVYVIEHNVIVYLFIPKLIHKFINIGERYSIICNDKKYEFPTKKGNSYG